MKMTETKRRRLIRKAKADLVRSEYDIEIAGAALIDVCNRLENVMKNPAIDKKAKRMIARNHARVLVIIQKLDKTR